MSLDDDLGLLDELRAAHLINEWQHQDMRGLLLDIADAPNPIEYRHTLDRDARGLLSLAEYWLDDQRVDSPETCGESSYEGPDFPCCSYDDEEGWEDDQ